MGRVSRRGQRVKYEPGYRFPGSKWTVIRRDGSARDRSALWLCRCDCGTIRSVKAGSLVSGASASCGCTRLDAVRLALTKHGHAARSGRSPEYQAWTNMLARCYLPDHPEWHRYGARGIAVCEQWRESFEEFLADVGERPSDDLSLDRYPDVNGHYEPGNVRWATGTQQQRNRRDNLVLELDGEKLTVAEWSERVGINRNTLSARVRKGWSAMDALNRPIFSKTPFSR